MLRGNWQDRKGERQKTERDYVATHAKSEAAKTRGESLLLLPTPWHRHHARVRDPSCRPTQHPSHRDAATGFDLLQPSHFTLNWLKYLIYPSKSQNLCLWYLCFSESVPVFFFFFFGFLALWLSLCLCKLWLCVCDYLSYII